MPQGLGLAVTRDLATIVALFLPGFIAVSLFGLTNRQIARNRPALQWALWSLAVSLVLVAPTHAVFGILGWPRSALDPQFYLALLALAIFMGYSAGRLAGTERGRRVTTRLHILLSPWTWVQVLSSRRSVVVHLNDGTVLYGYPRHYTDDPREEIRELYSTQPMVLTEDAETGDEQFILLPETEGVLIESSQIRFIQLLQEEP